MVELAIVGVCEMPTHWRASPWKKRQVSLSVRSEERREQVLGGMEECSPRRGYRRHRRQLDAAGKISMGGCYKASYG